MIIFRKIRWKNFLSTGNSFIGFDLDKATTTILIGDSGSGKSIVLDAISFALFGKPFRNINKAQTINSVNKKNCLVEIEFDIGQKQYLIRRGVKPNVFDIYVDSQLVDQDAHIKDYQDYLETQILKFNYKSFAQIIILGASNFIPFMQLKPLDRRIIIESLLDIEVFSAMNVLLKQRMVAARNEKDNTDRDISLTNTKIDLQKAYIQNITADKKSKIEEYIKKIELNRQYIADLNARNEDINNNIQILLENTLDKSELEIQYSHLRKIIDKLKSSIHHHEKEIEFYLLHSECPTCKQLLSSTLKESEIKTKTTKIEECNRGLKIALTQHAQINAQLKVIANVEIDIQKNKMDINKNNNQIVGMEKYMQQLESDIDLLNNQIQSPCGDSDTLVRFEEELGVLSEKKNSLISTQHIQTIACELLRDGGVKSRIIKQFLPHINKLINRFLSEMNFFVTFNIDEEFKESIKSRWIDDFSYSNFSEGEKQRIDLALLFTWRTIAQMKNSIHTNLLILDEVFDSYLDTSTTENVLALLKSASFKGMNIFVISHKETIADKFDNIIHFTKIKNFSIIK